MRQGRFTAVGLATLVAVAVSAAPAAAATDDTAANFAAGTTGPAIMVTEPGELRLRSEFSDSFAGPALPSGMQSMNWDTANGGYAFAPAPATMLSVNGARVFAPGTFAGPRVLEFRATFGDSRDQHIGFGDNFNVGPWAMFSTGSASSAMDFGLYARTRNTGTDAINTLIPDVDPLVPHTYRIMWNPAGGVQFFVDGVEVATGPVAVVIPAEMRPIISDFHTATTEPIAGGAAVNVDWISMTPYAADAEGEYTSQVFDAGDRRSVWQTLTVDAAPGVIFETRTGNTADPNDGTWSPFTQVTGGVIPSPPGRYGQYRATLTAAAPIVERVDMSYTPDVQAPDLTFDATVSGTTATATFSSTALDLAGFECSLDNGAFSACTNPKQFAGLAPGTHTIAVEAIDKLGNRSAPVVRTVEVKQTGGQGNPPGGGGGGNGGGGNGGGGAGGADVSKPKVTVAKRTVRASSNGRVKLAFGCPANELRCTISVRLIRGLKAVAGKKSIVVDGGETGKATLTLKRSARNRLADRGKLNVTAIVVAKDAAGNVKSSQLAMTVRAQS